MTPTEMMMLAYIAGKRSANESLILMLNNLIIVAETFQKGSGVITGLVCNAKQLLEELEPTTPPQA